MPNRRVIPCYGIRKGRDAPLVVNTWAEVVSKTSDFPGAEFKKFKSIDEATAYIQDSGQAAASGPAPPGSFTLLFDGGSRGNPGVSGAGAALFDEHEQEIWSGYKYVGEKNTNNEAEYSGLILGLQAVVRLGIRHVIVKGDSQLVIQQMLGRWRVSAPKLTVMHKQATSVVKQGDLVCTWQHVPRSLNTRADLLANIAMDSRGEGEVFGQSPPVASGPDPAAAAAAAAALVGASVTPTLPGIGTSSAGASTPVPAPAIPTAALTTPGTPAVTAPSPAANAVFAAALAAGGGGALGVPPQTPTGAVPATVSSPTLFAAPSPAAAAAIAAPAASPVTTLLGVATPARPVVDTPNAMGLITTSAGPAVSTAIMTGLQHLPERRFMVHVAAWKMADSSPGATAAILFEEGPWRRLKVLMRVGRCSAQRQYPQDREHGKGWTGGAEGMAVVADMLRVMGEALEEVEVLGGGKLAAVTNDSQLAMVLANASRSTGRGARSTRGDPFASNPSLSRVLNRWMSLDGVLLETSDENEIASAVMLARCCAEPPPVSSLAWNRGPEHVIATPEIPSAVTASRGGITPSRGGTVASVSSAATVSTGAVNTGNGGGSAASGGASTMTGAGAGAVTGAGAVPSEDASAAAAAAAAAAANGGGGAVSDGVTGNTTVTTAQVPPTLALPPVAPQPTAAPAAPAHAPPPGPAPGATRMTTAPASPFPGFSGGDSDSIEAASAAPMPGGLPGQPGWLKRPAPRVDAEAGGGARKVARTEEAADKGDGGGVTGTASGGGGGAAVPGAEHVPI